MTSEELTQRDEETESSRMFIISEEHAASIGAALPLMIANRLGYMDRQALEEEPTADSDAAAYIDLIVASSSHPWAVDCAMAMVTTGAYHEQVRVASVC